MVKEGDVVEFTMPDSDSGHEYVGFVKELSELFIVDNFDRPYMMWPVKASENVKKLGHIDDEQFNEHKSTNGWIYG